MPSAKPFIDSTTGELDTTQVVSEAVPIGKLVGLFVGLSLVPFGLTFLALGNSLLGVVLAAIGQFVLAVGAAVVLVYAVARGRQLSGADAP
ncbi:hypothetical protein I7X12_08155 [Halosimplex litoreum]|uniref:Uncharacterized protein n=1 Tax=Halosimplex litoreum TaxID=1198301 RepID=A0A7U3WAC8_9EURY|nr:hypothetical protein [Halosimplex litoreum]QPV64573.1 hypothetical protein I7X12_08155 [Halosimplex litoreum]